MVTLALAPLPIRDDWAPAYTRARGDANRDFAYDFADAEGMPGGPGGRRVHGGYDHFAPGGTPVRAPWDGRIVRSVTSTDSTGGVFGGVCAIERADGVCMVLRHVNPLTRVGQDLGVGETIARVSPWRDGWPHAHVELHRTSPGVYHYSDTFNPRVWTWMNTVAAPVVTRYSFEERPHDSGGNGPVIVGRYERADYAENAARLRRAQGWAVSVIAATDGFWYVLRWKEGTHGNPFRFGPWKDEEDRNFWLKEREHNTGRSMRPFQGTASLYPWPADS